MEFLGSGNPVTCVASFSVRFRRKERGTRYARKMAQVKEQGRCPLPPLSFFRSNFISRAAVPKSFFTPKLNGNACNAG